MILREETFEKFGYYPEEIAPKSSKRIVVKCERCGRIREVNKNNYSALCRSCAISESKKGEKNPNFGKHPSIGTREKMSEANKNPSKETRKKIGEAARGRAPWNKGKHHSDETKRKISEALKGGKAPWLGKHLSVETRKKLSEARKNQKSFPRHHTKPELIFEEICKKYDLPYKYTGDGAFWIGKNPSVNPDFVDCNGKKIAVEIFSYWHDPIRRFGKVRYSHTYEGRKAILKKYGWKLIVFWQEDLEREDAEQFVLSVLEKK